MLHVLVDLFQGWRLWLVGEFNCAAHAGADTEANDASINQAHECFAKGHLVVQDLNVIANLQSFGKWLLDGLGTAAGKDALQSGEIIPGQNPKRYTLADQFGCCIKKACCLCLSRRVAFIKHVPVGLAIDLHAHDRRAERQVFCDDGRHHGRTHIHASLEHGEGVALHRTWLDLECILIECLLLGIVDILGKYRDWRLCRFHFRGAPAFWGLQPLHKCIDRMDTLRHPVGSLFESPLFGDLVVLDRLRKNSCASAHLANLKISITLQVIDRNWTTTTHAAKNRYTHARQKSTHCLGERFTEAFLFRIAPSRGFNRLHFLSSNWIFFLKDLLL